MGWSQRVLAKALGVSAGAVAQWELDQTKPTPMNMIDICNQFGVQISTFFGPDGPYQGQFVDDPDEIAWLSVWRRTPKADRAPLLRAFSPHTLKLNAPKNSRKPDDAA